MPSAFDYNRHLGKREMPFIRAAGASRLGGTSCPYFTGLGAPVGDENPFPGGARGRVKKILNPPWGRFSAHILPSWASTIPLLMGQTQAGSGRPLRCA